MVGCSYWSAGLLASRESRAGLWGPWRKEFWKMVRPWKASLGFARESSALTEGRKSILGVRTKEAGKGDRCRTRKALAVRTAGCWGRGEGREGDKCFPAERWKKGCPASSLLPECISRHLWLMYPMFFLGLLFWQATTINARLRDFPLSSKKGPSCTIATEVL